MHRSCRPTPAKQDVSGLISAALPGVVSISVVLNGGQGAGTGFVISSDGEIATNAHVVADATKIDVKFADGSTAAATVLGVDRTDDLAVVKVDKVGLTALTLGTSADLRIGEPVVAIGNALDLTGGPTATEGIVSALDRTIDTNEGEHLTHLLQTDAAINPGNSGGPLLTLDGKVVGINSAGSQDAQNIGFAIAIDTAQPIIEQLQQGKTVTKAYLGVSTTPLDATVAARDRPRHRSRPPHRRCLGRVRGYGCRPQAGRCDRVDQRHDDRRQRLPRRHHSHSRSRARRAPQGVPRRQDDRHRRHALDPSGVIRQEVTTGALASVSGRP